jgi:hypothetical protein
MLLGLIEPTSGSRRSFGKSLERDRIVWLEPRRERRGFTPHPGLEARMHAGPY